MAPFTNPNPPGYGPVTNDPEWLNQSKGYNKQDVIGAAKSGAGELLQNIGSLVDKSAKGFASALTHDAEQEVRAAVEPIRNDNTVVNIAASEGTPILPRAAQTELNSLNKNEQRRAAGGMSETDYNIQLINAVKQLKTKYAGFHDEIDAAVKRITGIDPANELRRQALKNLSDQNAASVKEQERKEKWYEKHRGDLYVEGVTNKEDAFRRYNELDPKVGLREAERNRFEFTSKQALAAEKIDDRTRVTLTREAHNEANNIVSRAFLTIQNHAGKTFWEQYKQLSQVAQQGGIPDPKIVSALQQQALALREHISSQFRDFFAQERAPGRTFNNTLKKEDIQQIQEYGMAKIDGIIELLGKGGNAGFAAIGANILAQRENQDAFDVGSRYSTFRMLGAIRKLAGNEAAGVAMRMGQAQLDAKDAMHNATTIFGQVTGDAADKADPMHKTMDDLAKRMGVSAVPGKHQDLLLRQFLEVAKGKDPVSAKQALDVLYQDPTWFAKLPLEHKNRAYLQMASPAMLAKVEEIDTVNPGTKDMYVAWMKAAYAPIFKQAVDDFQAHITGGNANAIQVNPENLNLAITNPTDMPGNDWAGGGPNPTNVSNYINKFNQGINLIMPALEAKFGPEGAKQQMLTLLQTMGFNPNAPVQPGLLQKLGAVLSSALTKDAEAWKAVGKNPLAQTDADPFGRLPSTNTPTDTSGARRYKLEDTSKIEGTKLAKAIDDTESMGGRYDVALGNRTVPFTEMSVNEVLAWQQQDKAQTGASAAPAGRSQIVRRTLQGLAKEMGLTGNEKFDAELQDRMRDHLLERRGLTKFMTGEISPQQFIKGLRDEWEGLKKVPDRELLSAVMELSVSLGKTRPAGR